MAEYFSHDYNSRQDPKLAAVIAELGHEGYGLWWSIVEILHEQGGKIRKFPKLLSGLARILSTDEAKLKQTLSCFINDFELLKEDENYIWSERVLRNIQEREEKRRIKAEAGRKGGISSGESRSKTKQSFKQNEPNEAKERKGKERKENKDVNDTTLRRARATDIIEPRKEALPAPCPSETDSSSSSQGTATSTAQVMSVRGHELLTQDQILRISKLPKDQQIAATEGMLQTKRKQQPPIIRGVI